MTPAIADLTVGQSIGTRTVSVQRVDLVRYAGASGDLNPIHWNNRVATEVGLPGVIAHGMFTMGQAVNLVTDWAADPGTVRVDLSVTCEGAKVLGKAQVLVRL